MELGPAQKKAKVFGEEYDVSGIGEASPAGREKAWHESKKLLKRVAFLLNNPDIIPTDICFHVGEEAEEIHGHKIFFALASPVFHAMFYGSFKLQNDVVEVPDITPEAFRCLMKCFYTDRVGGIDVTNVMDVLVASRKYMVAKLTRYCYEFIQEKLTAEKACFFWKRARQAPVEIVEQQSKAEIKRNTAKAVLSESFLELPQDLLLELTSWSDLTIPEVDLYLAVKNWRSCQTPSSQQLIKFSREEGGILQYIRFPHFPVERLAAEQDSSDILSLKDYQELSLHKLVGRKLTSFNANHRTPVTPSLRLSLPIFVSNSSKERLLFATHDLLIWPDLAPKACRVLRQHIENDYNFTLSVMTDSTINGVMMYHRRVRKGASVHRAIKQPVTEAMRDIEKTSPLWTSTNFVCFQFPDEEPYAPELTVLSSNWSYLDGKLPEDVFGRTSKHGVVIGKVLDGPIEKVRRLATVQYENENNLLESLLSFECALISD